MRAGVGTGAVEGSIGEERNESVKSTQCGWNNWMKMAGVLGDKSIPPHVKGNIHKMIVQSAIGPTVGMETVPMVSTQVKKMEVT